MSKVAPNAGKRIDEAIEKAAPFAQEILTTLRRIILETDDRLVEDWKWGPCFHYKGNVVGIWGHQHHVNMIFWSGAALPDPHNLFTDGDSPKALRTIQFKHVSEINETILNGYIKRAVDLMDKAVKVKAKKVPIVMPDLFVEALKQRPELKAYYEQLSYSHQKEFAHHIGEAKREETKQRRLEKVLTMLKNKQGLHDKYKAK